MTGIHFIVERAPDAGYFVRAVGADIFTEADDLPMLRERSRDAARCRFDEADEPILIQLDRLTM